MKQEEGVYQEIATECMGFFNIEEQDFVVSQQVHMNNPMFQRTMMEMQMGVDDDDKNWKPPVDKAKAKEIFKYMEELKFKTMDSLAKHPMDPNDQMQGEDFTITMLVENAKTGDQLFEKFNIEEEDFTKCFKHFELMKDPEIIRMMQENMQKLGPEAMQMMMGMGGMG